MTLTRDQSGATAIEFGILLVPLLVTILGFMELGYQSYVRAQLQGVLNEVGRAASVESPQFGDLNTPLESRIEQRVRDRMAPLVKSGTYTFKLSNYQDYAGVGRPEALVTDVNGNGQYNPGDCWEDSNPNGAFDLNRGRSGVGGADDIVVYDVSIDVPRLSPIVNFIGASNQFQVNAKSVVRRQPFADQRKPAVAC